MFGVFLAKGFKTVIRSCASRSTLGVAQGCRYFVDEVGLEVAVCVSSPRQSNLRQSFVFVVFQYCENRDGCNGTSTNLHSISLLLLTLFFTFRRLY